MPNHVAPRHSSPVRNMARATSSSLIARRSAARAAALSPVVQAAHRSSRWRAATLACATRSAAPAKVGRRFLSIIKPSPTFPCSSATAFHEHAAWESRLSAACRWNVGRRSMFADRQRPHAPHARPIHLFGSAKTPWSCISLAPRYACLWEKSVATAEGYAARRSGGDRPSTNFRKASSSSSIQQ